MSTLTFTISAPMQSYTIKTASNFQFTNKKPTKSAIIGLLAASLGYRRGDNRIINLYDNLEITSKTLSAGTSLTDYQNSHYQFKTKIKNQQLYREYLQNSKFEITIKGELDLLKQLKTSLTHPKFALYLGRRACPPDRPIVPIIK